MRAPERVVATSAAPSAIGPYVQARLVDGVVYCSGQIGLDPATGALVAGGVAAEARRALANLDAVLQAAGAGLASVVKTTVFLVDMADFAAMNEVYADIFSAPYPARSTVAVAALPRGARVEIEAVARVG
ncbi:MAG: Rid family detoxifying hydrolase [Thermodesulfobacteriota bacterium]